MTPYHTLLLMFCLILNSLSPSHLTFFFKKIPNHYGDTLPKFTHFIIVAVLYEEVLFFQEGSRMFPANCRYAQMERNKAANGS